MIQDIGLHVNLNKFKIILFQVFFNKKNKNNIILK
jgi:hypothetical protein